MQRLLRFLISGLGSLALLALALASGIIGTPRAAAVGQLPADWIKGVNMIGYAPDPYKVENLPAAIASWKATGANSIAFAPRWFMDNPYVNTLAPAPELGSPSDESLIAAIQEAHRQGLRVMLRPYIDIKDGSWRANIAPADLNAWFANYTAFIDHYLDIAKQQNVEEFTLGVELINMTVPQNAPQWIALIGQARGRYSGLLTYSANWGKKDTEFQQITWWDRLDYIGLSAYYPLSEQDSPPEDQLINGWTSYSDHWGQTYHWVDDVKAIHDKFNK